jgi:hypothetical protein
MTLPTRILFLALAAGCACAGLRAEEPESKTTTTHHWHWKRDTGTFAWQVQADLPVTDFGKTLDHRTGLGLGAQWNHDRGAGHVRRTRLEWNVIPQGQPVGTPGIKTKASNYILSFDRLYHFSGTATGCYILGGLGGVRWFMDQTPVAQPTRSFHTTKLAVTAGAGYRFSPGFAAEARYLLSSVNQSFDGNVLQAGLNLRF